MKFKKRMAWFLVLLCLTALSGCGNAGKNGPGDPEAFSAAVQTSVDNGEVILMDRPASDIHDVEAPEGICESIAQVQYQGVKAPKKDISQMDTIVLKAENWTITNYDGTDYIYFDSDAGSGWLWWSINESNRSTGSLYTALRWVYDQAENNEQ